MPIDTEVKREIATLAGDICKLCVDNDINIVVGFDEAFEPTITIDFPGFSMTLGMETSKI